MINELIQKYLPFLDKKQKVNSIPNVTGSQKVDFILREYNNAIDVNASEMERASEMWKMYSGLNNDQYPDKIKKKMMEEGRNPFQANFVRNKVDGLAGSIIKNFFDVSFDPVNGELSDLTRQVKELMLIDKELLDWNTSYRKLVIDGLVHCGIEEMYIDFRYSPLGNIGFRHIMPGHVMVDPRWLSSNAWELKKAWKSAYLTPDEIKNIYKTKSEEIDNYIQMKEGTPLDFDNGDTGRGMPHFDMNEKYGDQYRVIEYHHMEKEKQKVRIVVSSGLIIPEGSDEFIEEWAVLNNADLSDGIMEREEEIDVYYVTTICPSISRYLVLEDKRALIQIGRLPFFPWSSARINGKNSGIPDLLKSIQQTYNFRESMLDYTISTSANGAMMIDPMVVDNDVEKMHQLQRNWNNPSFKMFSSPGALASGREFIKEFPRNTVDLGIVSELTRMVELSDIVSKQPAAADGRSEGSEETGILFARKVLQSEITQTILIKSLEQLWNDKGEAYLLLAKQLYSGVYRDFYAFGSGRKIELNVPIVTASGEVVQNDISQLPRMKVIVSQSPEGVTTRAVDRAVNTELLRVLGPESSISRALATKNVMKTLDNSKADRAKYEETSELEYQLAKETALTNLMNLKVTQMQLQQSLMMAGQPQMPMLDQAGQQQQGEPPQASGNPLASMQGSNLAASSQQ